MPEAAGGPLTLLAYVCDEDGVGNIDSVQVYYNGIPAVEMFDDGYQNDLAMDDGWYGYHAVMGPTGGGIRELLEIRATDRQGHESFLWPYLTITNSFSSDNKDDAAIKETFEEINGIDLLDQCRIVSDSDIAPKHGSMAQVKDLFDDMITLMEGRGPENQGSNIPGRGQAIPDGFSQNIRKEVCKSDIKASHYGPEILLAGYWGTEITTRFGGQLRLLAYVVDPDGPRDIESVEMYFMGVGTGALLYDDGLHGDIGAFDEVFGVTIVLPPLPSFYAASYLFELVATDKAGHKSAMWPYLSIE